MDSVGQKKNPIEVIDLIESSEDEASKKPAFAKRKHDEEIKDSNRKRRFDTAVGSTTIPIKLFATVSDESIRKDQQDPSHWSRTHCWTLREMLDLTRPIQWLVLGNYLLNPDFLLDDIPDLISIPNLTVFYGVEERSLDYWKEANPTAHFRRLDPTDDPNSSANPTEHKIPYGVHHSKFFLIGYADHTCRVVIHSANLRYDDVHLKAQAAYVQDFSIKTESSPSSSNFERDLVSYLDTYNYTNHRTWINDGSAEKLTNCIQRYDFSTAKAVLLPSTPGYHSLDAPRPLGHLKLRQAVSQYTTQEPLNDGPIICQFSSMGSLDEKYLHKLQASMDANLHGSALKLCLVYPTVDEIRMSVEGYRGGGSVPGSTKNVSKPFLAKLYHKWSSSSAVVQNPIWKEENVPHIKTYYQLDRDKQSMRWVALSSHNLSKAAWGEDQNSRKYRERRLFIRHWELGVFLSPQLLKCNCIVPWDATRDNASGDVTIPLPFKLMPDPYTASDRPWAVDQLRNPQPDKFGRHSLH
jgi:tyrosyl-DNA phosphodiesterase-1